MDSPSNTNRRKTDHIQMIPVDVHERELKRAEEMAATTNELRHLREGMLDIRATNKELLRGMKDMQSGLGDVAKLSVQIQLVEDQTAEKIRDIEEQVKPLVEDMQIRKGRTSWLNDLGVQAPLWIAIIGICGAAILWWMNKNGS